MTLSTLQIGDARSWAQLVRVPNTLTSCADVLAGMCIAGGASNHFAHHPIAAIVASCASISFYWAGMVMNDVFDVDQDREQGRPGPLVTGKIAISTATRAGIGLLLAGIGLSALSPLVVSTVGITAPIEPGSIPRWSIPAFIGCGLACSVIAYDGPLKKSPIAPLLMGICRSLNMALGVAVIAASIPVMIGWSAAAIVVGHGIYITGLTISARREADLSQSRGRLVLGWSICALGAALIAFSARLELDRTYRFEPQWVFPLLIAILLLPLARRAIESICTLRPPQLGLAIKQAIVSILFLDASIALQYAGDVPGSCIALMVVPTLLLGRWFRAT